MGDEESAPEPEEPIAARPVPPEDGPVTAEEVAAWSGMSTAERMASVGTALRHAAHKASLLENACNRLGELGRMPTVQLHKIPSMSKITARPAIQKNSSATNVKRSFSESRKRRGQLSSTEC